MPTAFDLSYLGDLIPPQTTIGLAFEGSSVGMVAYTVTKEQEFRPLKGTSNSLEMFCTPEVWWSYYEERTDLNSALAKVRHVATMARSATVVIEGGKKKGLLRRELDLLFKEIGSVRIVEFARTGGGYYKLEEVVLAVLADIRSGQIGARPEFENRPEREELMRHLGSIEAREGGLTALQQAFVYGMGYWSCAKQRPKYHVGPSNFAIY